MIGSGLKKILAKYWILILALVVGLGGLLIHLLAQPGLDPEQLLADYGYYIILVWTFLEGETIVIIAGLLAPKIGLDLWLVALCAFSGAMLSDQLMFTLGKYKGERILSLFPSIAMRMNKATALFKKYDTLLILSFRFIYGVRNVTPIMLGISKVGHKKFFILNFIGASIWAFSFTYGGYYAGKTFLTLVEHTGHGIFYVIVVGLVIAGGLWLLRARRVSKKAVALAKRQKQISAEEAAAARAYFSAPQDDEKSEESTSDSKPSGQL